MEHTVIQNGYQKRETCASCGGNSFETILDLGVVPLAGYFPTKEELKNESKYPLSLLVCNDCKLVQTDSVINPKLLFEDYRYLSSNLRCEPNFGKRGLYNKIGATTLENDIKAYKWIMNYSDGHHTLFDIAKLSNFSFTQILSCSKVLERKGLITKCIK